jgi:hypothetical protein
MSPTLTTSRRPAVMPASTSRLLVRASSRTMRVEVADHGSGLSDRRALRAWRPPIGPTRHDAREAHVDGPNQPLGGLDEVRLDRHASFASPFDSGVVGTKDAVRPHTFRTRITRPPRYAAELDLSPRLRARRNHESSGSLRKQQKSPLLRRFWRLERRRSAKQLSAPFFAGPHTDRTRRRSDTAHAGTVS